MTSRPCAGCRSSGGTVKRSSDAVTPLILTVWYGARIAACCAARHWPLYWSSRLGGAGGSPSIRIARPPFLPSCRHRRSCPASGCTGQVEHAVGARRRLLRAPTSALMMPPPTAAFLHALAATAGSGLLARGRAAGAARERLGIGHKTLGADEVLLDRDAAVRGNFIRDRVAEVERHRHRLRRRALARWGLRVAVNGVDVGGIRDATLPQAPQPQRARRSKAFAFLLLE